MTSPPPTLELADASIVEIRDRYRPSNFRLSIHLVQTLGVAAVIAGAGSWLARDASPRTWLWTPVFWLLANGVEWAVHRYFMHRPLGPRTMYRNHALWHHTSFPHRSMAIASRRDLGLVMMPWYTLVLVFTFVSPIVGVAWLVGGPSLAGVFLVASVSYFLVYETLHTLYHLDARSWSWLPRIAHHGLQRLASHHREHHRLDRMRSINFNVTVPISDYVLRTHAGRTVAVGMDTPDSSDADS